MQTAGFSIQSFLHLLAFFLALIGIAVMLHKRNRKRLYAPYLLICLLAAAIRQLLAITTESAASRINFLVNFLWLAEFLALFLLLQGSLPVGKIRRLLAYLLTAVLSVELTAAWLLGFVAISGWNLMLHALLLSFLSGLVFFGEMKKESIFFYQAPLFWISLASGGYFVIYLLIRLPGLFGDSGLPPGLFFYQALVQSLADNLRILLFALAGFVGMRDAKDWGIPGF